MVGFSLGLVPSFPAYTGPYKVGTIDLEVPVSELSPTLPSPDSKVTTINARIFYPCQPTSKTFSKVYWYPNPQSEYFAAFLRFLGASSTLASAISLFPRTLYSISLPAYQNANLLDPQTSSGRWPTMIFSHGLGGTRNMYSHICGSVASHGVVVIAPEHRDGSAPVSFIRDKDGKIVHTVGYQTIPHKNTSSTQLSRNAQLKQRLWELGESYNLVQKLDKGAIFSNHAATKAEKKVSPDLNLSMFSDRLDVQRPSSVHFAGHSFGAVSTLQFLKTVFYDPATAPESYQPLYVPPRDSPIVSQITARTSLTLLDCWMLPTLDPTTAWLHDKPLPAYTDGGPGGRAILAVLSEGFYRWERNWKEQRRALSPDPSLDPEEWTAEKLGKVTAPQMFYPTKSAHLSQSDFGVLFPWLTKKAFKVDEPERMIVLNTRAILEAWRNNGAEVSDTSKKDMEIVDDARNAKTVPVSMRLDETMGSSEETLAEGEASFKQDHAILLRDGSVRGWNSLGLGEELPFKDDSDGPSTTMKASAAATTAKDAGRIIKEQAQNGTA